MIQEKYVMICVSLLAFCILPNIFLYIFDLFSSYTNNLHIQYFYNMILSIIIVTVAYPLIENLLIGLKLLKK